MPFFWNVKKIKTVTVSNLLYFRYTASLTVSTIWQEKYDSFWTGSLVCMCKNIVFFPIAERFSAQTFWISTEFAPVYFPRFVLKNDFCAQGLSVQLCFFSLICFKGYTQCVIEVQKRSLLIRRLHFFSIGNGLEAPSNLLCVFIFLFFFIPSCCVTSKYHGEKGSISQFFIDCLFSGL